MRVAVVGTGHVGLVTAAALASLGHEVCGVDSDAAKLELLRAGRAPFFEPGLQELLDDTIGSGRLRFAADIAEAVAGSEVAFICVGTPARASGEANLSAVERAARAIAASAAPGLVVAEKSTVPAGTAQRVQRTLALERPDLAGSLHVVSNPEFLREGSAVRDALRPDRILVGAADEAGFAAMRALYEPLVRAGVELIETDIATAELSKHACNAFLALKISYINALARICERAGADVTDVARIMGSDPRIGPHFLSAGLGYGGYCFPKDIQAFERMARDLGYDFPLLREIERINDEAVEAAFAKVSDALWNLEGKRVALLGLAFKAGTDDVRFSPSLRLGARLLEEGAAVVGYDPHAGPAALRELVGLELASDPYAAATGAHCAVLATEWDELAELDLPKLAGVMAFPVLVDGRNVIEPSAAVAAGFEYHGMGRAAR